MKTPSASPAPAELLHETDARMVQALENFFQRSHGPIQDAILRDISTRITPEGLTTGQACLDWINAYPETLSTAFAEQFRRHLERPDTFSQTQAPYPAELQLVDDDVLRRQLAVDKIAAQLTENLRADMLLLFGRMQSLRRAALEDETQANAYGPLPVVRALSHALDTLDLGTAAGTLLLQCARVPLQDTLKQTYAAINQFLAAQDLPVLPVEHILPAAAPRKTEAGAGHDILAHIQSVAAHATASGVAAATTASRPLLDRLTDWPIRQAVDLVTDAPARLLRQLQSEARKAGTGAFDLAVLDAVAGLFDFILDDPDVSPHYKAAIAHLQIPALRVALVAPDFFSDDQHPARQLIDLAGAFSRHFPEHAPSHDEALGQVESVCAAILDDPGHPVDAFARAHRALDSWLGDEEARTEALLAAEVAQLEHIERQELGTLLALENLQDLTARYPAPESVLRRLEAAWVPHMATLYMAESGEGPAWRVACSTLLQLFQSLMPPDNDTLRESRLQSIPRINAALREGLLAQGAEPAQLKNFFSAITAAQEAWIRPAVGQRETTVSRFTPRQVTPEQIESLAREREDTPDDDALQQAQQLLEGDWVDFAPPYEGLATARVAWVGLRGYLLFCDSEGEQRFSFDCERLAAEIRAGRAHIPEHSLTRKAFLRLRSSLEPIPG
ncbi:MAG: DUF1631 family protein [Thiobacillus sp.]|nr:DUF1631 family protein [Thiobacillus sp.]